MSPEIPFTIGFAFDPPLENVLLIRKARGPSFNIGKMNGIGGKFNVGEGIRACMCREFREETGIVTAPQDWFTYHVEHHLARAEQTLNPRLYFLTTVLNHHQFYQYRSTTDEPVEPRNVDYIMHDGYKSLFTYNLPYLVKMAQCWHRHPEHRWIEG